MSVELPKDAEGREIPLDTPVLYKDDGTAVKIIGYSYVLHPNDEWIVTSADGEPYYPYKLHLHNQLIEDVISKTCRYMEKRFAELKERCK